MPKSNPLLTSLSTAASRLGLALPAVLAGVWVAVFWGEWVWHAAERMLMQGGVDGIKNYYTLAWYLDHNEAWAHFEGMNHPDGDLTVYTDGQPLFAWGLRMLGVGGGASVGILNALLLLSLVPATCLTWDVFKRLGVQALPAALFALAVGVLMPQWERLGGHFSLAHMWAVPAMVWLLLRVVESRAKAGWAATYALLSLALYFTHPYLGLMASGWAVGAAAVAWFVARGEAPVRERTWTWGGVAAGAGVLPVAVFQLVVFLLDTHADRPTDPAGFWKNHSSLSAWFAPHHGPLARQFSDFVAALDVRWEVRAYVGVAATVLAAVWVGTLAARRFRNVAGASNFVPVAGGAALLALFALGWVFQAAPILVEFLSPLKNFRVLGRFAWPGVYVLNVALLAWAWRATRERQRGRLALTVLVGLGLVESADWHRTLTAQRDVTTNEFSADRAEHWRPVLDLAARNGCTSILPLPYFHKGSEMWDTPADEGLASATMIASFHSGLPTVASILSRTSVTETRNHLSWRSPFCYAHPGLEALEGEGPLLVVANEALLNEAEAALLAECDRRVEHGGLTWGTLEPGKLGEQPLLEAGKPIVGVNQPGVLRRASDREEGEETTEYMAVWEFAPGELPLGKEVECSFWFTQKEANRPTEAFFVAVRRPGGNRWEAFNTLNRSCHFSGDSVRFSARFTPTDSDAEHRFMLRRPARDLGNVQTRHFLLRPADVNVVDTLANGLYVVNNHAASARVLPSEP